MAFAIIQHLSSINDWLKRLLHVGWRRGVVGSAASPYTAKPRLPATAPLPTLETLGAVYLPYSPVFERPGPWIDADHQAIARLPLDGVLIRGETPGFLRPADALALYELAYFARGDVLELGSAWGLSTSILGRAIRNSGRRARVASIELDPNFQQLTRTTMQAAQLTGVYEGLAGAADEWIAKLLALTRQFDVIFVDHDHSYPATRQVCVALSELLAPGGYAVFHDFNDERNRTEPFVYGVHRAVSELATRPGFAFCGVVGCCGLVQRGLA